ncbi:MAG: RNA polymerase sigma factor WhiG [Brevinematales bacterium]|jgi:RNA polymerase sigma factor for flagellar operon FliA|nr:RNA polymerase sigma factor WhiG [Brevinematales bacterium]OHD60656.1 MAG: RNA polymerase sigma factor WhiG [Spirochaetes bacterium GWF1_49_6]
MKGYEELEMLEEDELWDKYIKSHDQKIRNYFIEKYAPLVKYVAGRIAMNVPNSVEFNDLVSYGILGLIDAIDKFDPKREIKFKTYAVTRIRGSIFDELRAIDWLPRSVRQKAKEIERTIADLEAKLGRSAKDEEIAEAMGVNVDEFHTLLLRVSGNSLISMDENWFMNDGSDNAPMSIEETLESSDSYNPDVVAEKDEIKKLIARALMDLPEREKQVLILYYYEGLTLKEIGSILAVTESRVSQLHTKAIMRLRGKLEKIKEGFVQK